MSKKKSSTAKNEDGILIVAQNKKARHDYEILDTLETGIVLKGSEVKSIRAGEVNLKESYVRLQNQELYLIGAHISPYKFSPVESHKPTRDRKLLAHKKEILRLDLQADKKGLTLVPLKIYFKNGRCKLEIGVGRGKKLHDKREDIKAKEAKREIDKAMKGR